MSPAGLEVPGRRPAWRPIHGRRDQARHHPGRDPQPARRRRGREFIDRYDTAGTLFYLDPPYWGLEDDHGVGAFIRAEFVGLTARLGRIAGRFVLSGNDVPDTREIFRRFAIEAVATRYTVSGKWSDVMEIVVTGPSAEPLPTSRDLLSFSEGG